VIYLAIRPGKLRYYVHAAWAPDQGIWSGAHMPPGRWFSTGVGHSTDRDGPIRASTKARAVLVFNPVNRISEGEIFKSCVIFQCIYEFFKQHQVFVRKDQEMRGLSKTFLNRKEQPASKSVWLVWQKGWFWRDMMNNRSGTNVCMCMRVGGSGTDTRCGKMTNDKIRWLMSVTRSVVHNKQCISDAGTKYMSVTVPAWRDRRAPFAPRF
jgi:hypothetical protein